MRIELTNNTNNYMVGERTQVKFCFTIKGKRYAKALVNTIYKANFESYNNFEIYCCDNESMDIMKQYNLPYKISFGEDVYNDKVLNLVKTSINNPNTVIIALDVITVFDFHVVRGCLGRLTYKDNTIYYPTYFDILGFNKKNIMANVLLAYNMKENMLNNYLTCLRHTTKSVEYPEKSKERYFKETKITEESVLTFNRKKLKLKHMTNIMINKIHYAIMFCDGGNTLNKIFDEKIDHYRCYSINKELLD